jgi:hypothetical protein
VQDGAFSFDALLQRSSSGAELRGSPGGGNACGPHRFDLLAGSDGASLVSFRCTNAAAS